MRVRTLRSSATMRPERSGLDAWRKNRRGRYLRVERTFIDIEAAPNDLLRCLGKDERLVPYGGANFGMPLDLIETAGSRIVPNDRFFLRSNGPVPFVDPESWRLDISGNVEQPLSLSLAELRRLGSSQVEAFLECAGNGRTRFEPVPPGTPWRNDAVGNAVWEGVPLACVLDLAGVKPGTVDVVTQGADFPEMRRGLPLTVARDPQVLVIWDERGDPLRPVAEMPPKSVIVTPADRQKISQGSVTVAGWAWSGFGPVQTVEVSIDGGCSWQTADLHPGERRGWRRWDMIWNSTPGQHRLQARATDERLLSQPVVASWNAKGYQMNAIQEIVVEVAP